MPISLSSDTRSYRLLLTTDEHGLNTISEKIIGCAFAVSNTLGAGFLEKVYQNAGLKAEKEKVITIYYKEKGVGEYLGDILVNQQIIIETKAVQILSDIHKAQLLNYLKRDHPVRLRLPPLQRRGIYEVQIKRMVL